MHISLRLFKPRGAMAIRDDMRFIAGKHRFAIYDAPADMPP